MITLFFLMLRDEYPMLGLGEKAKEVAGSTLLFEEFVARKHKAGRLKLNLTPWENSKKVLGTVIVTKKPLGQ